ncbi:MAG: glycosyltransferase family 4 protein [Dehalococcoidia bacterium]
MRTAVLVSAPVDPTAKSKAMHGLRPRQDYDALAEELGATLITPFSGRGKRGGALGKSAALLKSAWQGFARRGQYDTIVSDVDRVGVLLAALLKITRSRKRHVVVCHGKMAHPVDRRLVRLLRLHTHMDRLICYGPEIAEQLQRALPVSPSRIITLRHAVDHRFWKPLETEARPLVVSAGLFQRDYPTLVEAIREMGVTLEVAAHSPWVPEKERALTDASLPDNVRLSSHDYASLRELYASALCVAVPLVEHDTQAGSLVVYEALAMGKPVIVTRTRGQAAMGLVQEGETGFYVEPGDVEGWRRAVSFLHEHPDEAMRMGQNARRVVEEGLNLDAFVEEMAVVVKGAAASSPVPSP